MKTLIFWQLRQIRTANVIAVVVAAIYFATNETPVQIPGTFGMLIGVMLHSIVITHRLCRISRENSFLHTQGFSRDQIWRATWNSVSASALLVVGTCGIIIWTGLRVYIQNSVFKSPWYLIPNPEENWLPAVLLVHYGAIVPLLLYFRIRMNHPYDDPAAGWVLLCFGLACHVKVFSVLQHAGDQNTVCLITAIAYVPFIAVVARSAATAHRSTEATA